MTERIKSPLRTGDAQLRPARRRVQERPKPGHWQNRYIELRAEYQINPAPFEPKRDSQAMVELLFPELLPLP